MRFRVLRLRFPKCLGALRAKYMIRYKKTLDDARSIM